MTPEEIVERAAEVLVAHQRMDAGSCLCGWGELGRAHPKHQAQALADAGVLLDPAAVPRPDLSRLPEMDGYLDELASETGDRGPAELWAEVRRSINAPLPRMAGRPWRCDLMTTPRQAMVEQAQARAELARRNQQDADAAQWDAIAAELRGPSDLATATRLLADDFQEAGHVVASAGLRVLAEAVEGKFPCGHEARVVPIAAHRATVAGESREVGVRGGELQPDGTWVETWTPGRPDQILIADLMPTPRSGGGASRRGADEAIPPAPSAPAPPPHLWLLADDDPRSRECRCLIGDNHTSTPRFEKES